MIHRLWSYDRHQLMQNNYAIYYKKNQNKNINEIIF